MGIVSLLVNYLTYSSVINSGTSLQIHCDPAPFNWDYFKEYHGMNPFLSKSPVGPSATRATELPLTRPRLCLRKKGQTSPFKHTPFNLVTVIHQLSGSSLVSTASFGKILVDNECFFYRWYSDGK